MKHCTTCTCFDSLDDPAEKIPAAYHRDGPLTEQLAALRAETETEKVRALIVREVAFRDDYGLTAHEAWKDLFPERAESNGLRPRFTELQGKIQGGYDPNMAWIMPKPKLDEAGQQIFRDGKPVFETRKRNIVWVLSPRGRLSFDYTVFA